MLGRGRSGTVYLAKHKDLEEYRAVKLVEKTRMDYEQFRKEALILKELRHPGIPIVYDLVETEQFSLLIEEFLEGETLYALVSGMGHFSAAMTIRYGIQICHLVNILHSARPNPVLYLDLQPKNLLLCHDVVKLIDFDHAVPLKEAGELALRYGTEGCAAPEQYTGERLDERTDIYAIGAVLYYMLTGTYPAGPGKAQPGWRRADGRSRDAAGRRLEHAICRCLEADKEKRYQTAEELCRALEAAGDDPVSSLTIGVAGSRPGAGATHIAVGLTAYLRRRGISAMYQEENDSGAVRRLAAWAGTNGDRQGIVRIRGIPMRPRYGPGVRLSEPPYPVRVLDWGGDWQRFLTEQIDACLLVCGAKPWETEEAGAALGRIGDCPGLAVALNHFCRRLYGKLPGKLSGAGSGDCCFLMPEWADPFGGDHEADQVYERLMVFWLGTGTEGRRRRWWERTWLENGSAVRERLGRLRPGGRWGLSGPGGERE